MTWWSKLPTAEKIAVMAIIVTLLAAIIEPVITANLTPQPYFIATIPSTVDKPNALWTSTISASASRTTELSLQATQAITTATYTVTPVPSETSTPSQTPTVQFQADDVNWATEYYDNIDFLGPPIQTGTDEAINFDWGSVSPALGVPKDFAARWTRCINFEYRYYDFYTNASSPDIVRAYIDDTLINKGGNSRFLVPAGRHCLRVDFLDYGYGASVEFDFKPGPAAPIIDLDTAWLGEYFDNNQFEGLPAVTQYDPVIDFDWGEISPAIGIPAEFSVRWTRCLEFEDRQYEFYTRSSTNDPVKVYMDDTLINSGGDSKFLVPAGRHCLRVEYLDFGYGASVEFSFK